MGPLPLENILGEDEDFPIETPYEGFGYAKLYQGPTRPNWIDHDPVNHPECPVNLGDLVMIQDSIGMVFVGGAYKFSWSGGCGFNPVKRYTVIEP